jgi:hypothetical protein
VQLVTFGSPLMKLYAWAFPAWVNEPVLSQLCPAGPSALVRWLNFSYPTDPIGGRIDFLDGYGDDTRDIVLPDPDRCWHLYGQPLPQLRGHRGYWRDPAMWAVVDERCR